MPTSVPIFGATFILVSQSEVPALSDLGPVERIVSYAGLLAIGWFFWKRETNRSDKSYEELKKENERLQNIVGNLEKEIRTLLREQHDLPYRRKRMGQPEKDEDDT